MKDLGPESMEKYIAIWEVAAFRQILYCTFFCLFIAKHFYFLLFNEVPGNIETWEGFTSSEWEMCIYMVFLENHFKNVKTPTLAWHGAYAYNPNCWQPEGEEIGVKAILNYKPVSRRAWDTRKPVYQLFSIAGIKHDAQDNLQKEGFI